MYQSQSSFDELCAKAQPCLLSESLFTPIWFTVALIVMIALSIFSIVALWKINQCTQRIEQTIEDYKRRREYENLQSALPKEPVASPKEPAATPVQSDSEGTSLLLINSTG